MKMTVDFFLVRPFCVISEPDLSFQLCVSFIGGIKSYSQIYPASLQKSMIWEIAIWKESATAG